ncbi:MAG: helix-turn-helix domain-containing protein [Cyanobacteria bacterium J06650_10]
MSIRQILQVWEHQFSHPHQAVMLALADHAHEDGTGIRPSINRIAWKTGYSERSVQNIMAQLRQIGVLAIAVPATHNTPNEYRFDWSVATPKPSFDEFVAQKKGQKGRGAKSAPLLKMSKSESRRGAVPVKQGCSSDAGGVQLPCNRGAVPVKEGCKQLHPNRQEPSREPSIETKEPETKEPKEEPKEENFQFGVVIYRRSPDDIDFADLWATNPGMAKMELRAIAPGHRRLEMVAHGFGQWWVGPGLNDFDESLIKACQKRKRKFQQPDSVGDAKTFINNMLKSADWANFSLRCDEARSFQTRMPRSDCQVEKDSAADSFSGSRKLSQADRLTSSIGLARFKVSQGDYARAREIAALFNLSYETIGLQEDGRLPIAQTTE